MILLGQLSEFVGVPIAAITRRTELNGSGTFTVVTGNGILTPLTTRTASSARSLRLWVALLRRKHGLTDLVQPMSTQDARTFTRLCHEFVEIKENHHV